MFFSHPKEEDDGGIFLEDHLLKVAETAASLISNTRYHSSSVDAAFYCGLLHDIGKLNPYYQEIFQADRKVRGDLEKNLLTKYDRQHSIFSAWAASHLLRHVIADPLIRHLVLAVIAGHHSRLSRRISSNRNSGSGFLASKEAIAQKLPDLYSIVKSNETFASLNWEGCKEEFRRPISFQWELRGIDHKDDDDDVGGSDSDNNDHNNGKNEVSSFLEACIIFSALLQGDRGSFNDWSPPTYNLKLDTSKLVRVSSRLGILRENFQRAVFDKHERSADISVIHAPTGIGKTKIFLDLISRYTGLERVIYFSPLLALTEDFEEKIRQVAEESLDEILIYNHLYSGMISERSSAEAYALQQTISGGWNFINESFNSKFIITTTQRLLLTLYSNLASDKLKLISFKNSLLILDEIQVLPKFLLPNLVAVLREICAKMNSKVLLVSATVPNEIREARLRMYETSREISQQYNARTMKQVIFAETLDLPSKFAGKKVLFMNNTRRKAYKLFENVQQAREGEKRNDEKEDKDIDHNDDGEPSSSSSSSPPLYYLTTGVRKKTRAEILAKIKSQKECIVVSTQVVEAGVDVSFSEVYREVAPLDSIIQVMGRLNREGEITSPILHVFRPDRDHRPYSELEYNESLKILRAVRNSQELYDRLEEYYRVISFRNEYNKNLAERLARLERTMDFDGVWELISKQVFDDQDDVPVLIPKSEEELEQLKLQLLSVKKFDRKIFRKYAGLTASLPRSITINKLSEFFDPDLLEKRNILIPKKGRLKKLYDSQVGLDKWLK